MDISFVNKYFPFILQGTWVALYITLFSAVFGFLIGLLVAVTRIAKFTSDDLKEEFRKGGGISAFWPRVLALLKYLLGKLADIYIAVTRGTPTIVQLLIVYNIILLNIEDPTVSAIFAFSLNSGAYTAEIIRGGILSVDKGQMEAARSLGLNFSTSMRYVIIPQALKSILPALGNEFIVLLKETAIVSVIGVGDLVNRANKVMSITYRPYEPYISIAVIYLVLTGVFSAILGKYERRLRQSD